MNFICLDLEMNKPSNSIIQIGWCVGNVYTGEIIKSESRLVRPNEPIDAFITTLTGITQEMIDENGMSLIEAYVDLRSDAIHYQCNKQVMTWGGGDNWELFKQLKQYFNGSFDVNEYVFGTRRWFDIKTLFQAYCISNQLKMQSGLKKSCHRMDMKFDGPAHDAKQDAINTFKLGCKLLSLFKEK